MKTIKITLISLLFAFMSSMISFAQVPPPPPPDPGGDPCATGGSYVGANAPVGNGSALLVILAVGYGLLRMRQSLKHSDETNNKSSR